jgi:Leucine-rich repeat (LRR) protein
VAQHQEDRKSIGLFRFERTLSPTCTPSRIQNRIARIEGLDHLHNLEYLALNDNAISKLEHLKPLKKLLGLNLNNNDIEDID